MTIQSIMRPIVLTTVEVSTVFAVSYAINKVVTKVKPELGLWNAEWTRREKAIQAAKLIGLAVTTALVAEVAATAVRSTTERILTWNDNDPEYIPIDPEN